MIHTAPYVLLTTGFLVSLIAALGATPSGGRRRFRRVAFASPPVVRRAVAGAWRLHARETG